jgi:hypothetical protein
LLIRVVKIVKKLQWMNEWMNEFLPGDTKHWSQKMTIIAILR